MALTTQQALDEYGAVALLAKSHPDIKRVLDAAVKNEWDAARFEREIWKTTWYKNLSDSARQYQIMQATDPGAYKATVGEKAREIGTAANAMGKTITPAQQQSLATHALNNGWDNTTLQVYLSHLKTTNVNGHFTAQAGDIENHIRSQFAAYGMPVSTAYLTSQVNAVLAGKQTTGGIDNQVIAQASKMFPQFHQDFLEGRSLSDIAQPLIQQMATTLELDPSSIDVNDKTIMRALHGDGKQPMPLYQFQEQLKADPRWQKTDNAKNAAFDLLAQIGKDWGFM